MSSRFLQVAAENSLLPFSRSSQARFLPLFLPLSNNAKELLLCFFLPLYFLFLLFLPPFETFFKLLPMFHLGFLQLVTVYRTQSRQKCCNLNKNNEQRVICTYRTSGLTNGSKNWQIKGLIPRDLIAVRKGDPALKRYSLALGGRSKS